MAELETLKSTRDKFLAQLEETKAELTGDSHRVGLDSSDSGWFYIISPFAHVTNPCVPKPKH